MNILIVSIMSKLRRHRTNLFAVAQDNSEMRDFLSFEAVCAALNGLFQLR